MDFYYYRFPKVPAGILQKIEGNNLFYEPYRSFAHLGLMEDLKLGKECECNLESGEKIVVIGWTSQHGILSIESKTE